MLSGSIFISCGHHFCEKSIIGGNSILLTKGAQIYRQIANKYNYSLRTMQRKMELLRINTLEKYPGNVMA
jgi:hypothetical protein